MSHFVVTGARRDSTTNDLDTAAPNRLEINDFVKDEKMFSLYIQALDAMFKSPQEDPSSFFQIGGIHGLPYVPWNGAGEHKPAKPAGYCTHGSVLFPTWHRPYVALFEQIMQRTAAEIAETYTVDTALWQKTASDLRQPYWDWARNSVPPPEVISLHKVFIIGNNGQRLEIDNPFTCYRFRPIEPTFPEPFSRWSTTLRRPASLDSDAKDNVTDLVDVLRADQSDLTSKTYSLLTRVHTWPAFSNHTPEDGGSASNSLEAIHDAIHVSVGGTGHMGDPAVAAFDPIFYLHHCQIDRLLAMWCALNPDVKVSESREEGGTYTISPGAVVDENTPLAPFRKTQTSFWTSSDVAEPIPSQLGYSYPEFDNVDLSDRSAVQNRIVQVVIELYGPSRSRHHVSSSTETHGVPDVQETVNEESTVTFPPVVHPQRQGYVQSFLKLLVGSIWPISSPLVTAARHGSVPIVNQEPESWVVVPEQPSTPPSPRYWEWAARVRVKKYELGGGFSVLLFLGHVPDDPTKWRTSPSYVGGHHAFVNSTPQKCANCRRQKNLVIEGFVHLDAAIAASSSLHDSEYRPSDVKPFLQERLQWRVQKADGTPVPLEDMHSLEVTVVATRLYHLPGEIFPVSEEAVFHDDISHL